MKININKQENIKIIKFPDGQTHVILDPTCYEANVFVSITNAEDLFNLMLCANALENIGASKKRLYINYLMGARYDRIINQGDSFDLKVIANVINGLGFIDVCLFDPHSDVSPALINKSFAIDNLGLVREYKKEEAILIVPDAGAVKKAEKYLKANPRLVDIVYCIKSRDKLGNITLKVLEPEKCENRNCVIIDDICDGGGTFLAIASQIKPKHLTLIVSHAIFSKGIDVFKGKIDHIITSDSYPHGYNGDILTIKEIT